MGSLFVGSAICALLFDVHDPALIREAALVFVIGLLAGFAHRRHFKHPADVLFYVASMVMVTTAFVNGITFLGVTPVPRLRLYLKTFYLFSFLLFQMAVWRGGSRGLLFLIVILLSSNVFLSWYYLGVTLRSLPLALYVISGWFYIRRSKIDEVRLDRTDLAMLILLSTSFVSTVFAWDRANGVFGFAHLALGAPLFFIARHSIEESDIPRFLRYSVLVFSGAVVFFAIFVLVVVVAGGGRDLTERIGGYHVNGIGGYIAVTFAFVLWALRMEESLTLRILAGFVVPLALIVLVFTLSRASMLAVGVITLLAALHMRKELGLLSRRQLAMLIAGIFVFAAVVPALVFLSPLGRQTIDQLVSGNTMAIRVQVWQLYLANFWTYSPWIGFGPESYLVNAAVAPAVKDPALLDFLHGFVPSYGPMLHSHNVIVQELQNFGVLGLLAATGVALPVALQFFRELRRPSSVVSWKWAGFAAIIALFVQAMFDYTLTDPMTYYPVMLFLGFVMRPENGSEPKAAVRLPPGVVRALPYAALVIFLGAFWIGWNRLIFVRQATIFRNEYRADGFVNLTFLPSADLGDERIREFERQGRFFLPNVTDHRPEQMAGEVYYQAHVRRAFPNGLNLAEARFRNCLAIYPYSAFCARRLGQILKESGRTEESAQWNARSVALDPYGLSGP